MSEQATEDALAAPAASESIVAADAFEVSVRGAGVSLNRNVDQATALNVIALVLGGATTVPAAVSPQVRPAVQSPATAHDSTQVVPPSPDDEIDPHITIGEYIDECGAQRFPAKITAIGNFLELRLGQPSFNKEEVKSQFRPAGEAQPGNFHRDFSDAITQRWISEVPGEAGQYFVTKTGKAAIAGKFDRSLRRPTPTRRKKATTKPGNGDASASSDDNIETDLQDLDD